MDIVQTFYDSLATKYDKLFSNWQETTKSQALILNKIFIDNGFSFDAKILDCACGIGTQAIGLASLGYNVTASDISKNALAEAKKKATNSKVSVSFYNADFRRLNETFTNKFDVIIAMDNALPHMLTKTALASAVKSIANQINDGGIFVASIRDYDAILIDKPSYSPPYIYKTKNGQRTAFQTWDWKEENYKLTQYIIEDEKTLKVSKFNTEYRAVKREELTNLLLEYGFTTVEWKFSNETEFYQPIVVAKK